VNSWKVIPAIVFATVLIFGAGVFTGGILVDYLRHAHQRAAAEAAAAAAAKHTPAASQTNSVASANVAAGPAKPIKPPEILTTDFLKRLDGEMHLSKEEHDAILKIICDGQNEMRKVVQDARLEIRDVLTAEQREQFDELMKRPFRKPLFNTNAPPSIVFSNAVPSLPGKAP
jgi:hypothetical protein